MRVILSILFIVIYTTSTFASSTITFEQQSKINAAQKIKVFKPSSGFQKIDDVVYADHLFSKNTNNHLNISISDYIVWSRFEIKNTNQYPINILVEYRCASIQEIQFFIKKENILIHKKLDGTLLPFSNRNIKSRFFVKEITLEPGINYTIFTQIKNYGNKLKIPILIYDQYGFNQAVATDNLASGLVYGILVTLFFSGLLFLILRFHIKEQILYLLYMSAILFILVTLDGYAAQFLFTDNPHVISDITKTIPFVILGIYALFIKNYYQQYAKTLTHTRVYNIILYSSLIAFAVILLLPISILFTISFMLIIGIALLTMAFWESSQLKIPNASHRYFIGSISAGALILCFFSFQHYSNNYGYQDFHQLIKILVIIQLGLISLSFYKRMQVSHTLAHQESIDNLEKLNEVIKEQNTVLEKKVEERTVILKSKNKDLELQNRRNEEITKKLSEQHETLEKLNKDLELSFKKSSADHIKLHKALMINEEQRTELKKTLEEISNKNQKLELQNEEILTQRDKIKEQHHLLEIINRDITDSIQYAERIQNSILPPKEMLRTVFPECFVFFKPKDKLSGDLYWFETVEDKGKTCHLLAAIDCTGHGVPGALMSIIAKDGLNDAVYGKQLTKPGKIINHLNQVIIKTLNKRKTPDSLKDGMDLSMIAYYPEDKKILFSGARNPLYLIRDNNLVIYNGNIFSAGTIGTAENPVVFDTITIDYQPNDTVYLFSDGFADQFGGEKGNKFRYNRLRKMFKLLVNLPIEKQEAKTAQILKKWQGNYEQIDDILIIGIKL
ncbi:MAG: SpoIIE family protein phosphatase [Salinivirgaceae bacterium]|jgi:serine phosphatase RsbU (regulator of sigma subunit)|nr:SpoIIE family protein phosphatase [Salinivirgaceae bacterium]